MKIQSLKIIMFVLIGALLSIPSVYAETIVLKSGNSVEGKLLEKTDKYIKIDFQGVPLTYYLDEIEGIDGVKQTQPSLVKNNLSQENKLPYPSEVAEHDSGIEYYNKEYGIKIRHPKEWDVIDKEVHPETFKIFLDNSLKTTNNNLICVLGPKENRSNLTSFITVVVRNVLGQFRDLSAEELTKVIGQNLESSLPPGQVIIEHPRVVNINGKELIRYTGGTAIANGVKENNVNYAFVKGGKMYLINCIFITGNSDTFKKIADEIVGSIESIDV